MARFFSALTVTGSLMRLLILCHVENAVHIGEPTNNNGLFSLSFFIALSRMTLESTSHSAPSVLAVVRSSPKHPFPPRASLSAGCGHRFQTGVRNR